MNVPAVVALVVAGGAMCFVAVRLLRRPRGSPDRDREAVRKLAAALPVRPVEYLVRAGVTDALDLGRLAELRAFAARGETLTLTHPELARRFAELDAAIRRLLGFVEERAEGDGDLRRFPASLERERPDDWRALVQRWMDVKDDVTICHEEFFRAARRLLGVTRPKGSKQLFD